MGSFTALQTAQVVLIALGRTSYLSACRRVVLRRAIIPLLTDAI
jgi:hypothetical protein